MAKATVMNTRCFLAIGFLGLYVSVFQRVLDEIAKDYSLSKVAMGFIVTAHFIGLFIGPLIAGEVSDKLGKKIIITNAFVAFLIGLITVLISLNIYFLIIGVFIAGAGFGTLEGTATALLTDMTPGGSNRVIGVSQIFFSTGAVIGPFIAIFFIQFLNEWKVFYAVSIVLVLLFIYTFNKGTYPSSKIEEKVDGLITLKLLGQKIFLILFVSMVMYVGIEEGIAFWITSYVKESGNSEFYASAILSIFWGSMIIGRYVTSRFSDKLNELIILSTVVSIVFLLISTLTESFWTNIIAFFGLGFGFSGIWPMIMALANIYYSKYSGTASGIMMAGSAVGGGLLPLVMGYIGDVTSLRWSLIFCLIPMMIIIACHAAVMLLIKKDRKQYPFDII